MTGKTTVINADQVRIKLYLSKPIIVAEKQPIAILLIELMK